MATVKILNVELYLANRQAGQVHDASKICMVKMDTDKNKSNFGLKIIKTLADAMTRIDSQIIWYETTRFYGSESVRFYDLRR